MSKTMKLLGLVAIFGIFAACASMGGRRSQAGDRAAATTVTVDNRAALAMDIFIIRGGQRIRIGMADALSTTKLTIPRGIIVGSTDVRFLADPIGGNHTPVSQTITVNEGDQVVLTLPAF
ncbi:MAG: hypothetical protein ACRD3J_06565 [Thermoanaerobaculia bacterium]